MPSTLIQELESAFACGEMDSLKISILPFIRNHRQKILAFIAEFQRVAGPTPLDRMLKMFIIQQNLPFDMSDYMARQSHVIQKEVGDCRDAEQRRLAVTEWIHRKAENHRSHSMFQQVYCFDKMKEQLLPVIEEELGLLVAAPSERF